MTAASARAKARSSVNVSAIPIENIYYLLCYAWDALEEAEAIDVTPEQSLTLLDLFARVLIRGTRQLLVRGIDRDYQAHQQRIAGIRGKLDVAATVKGMTDVVGHTICTFDTRSTDIPHNRVLKATLRGLAASPLLNRGLASDASTLVHRLTEIRDVPLTAPAFRQVQVHRNNRLYDLLMHVCRLIHDRPFLDDTPGHVRFADFTGSRADMARLFEQFVYHFLQREQHAYTVRRPIIEWHNAQASDSDLAMLPIMRTDVVLTSSSRRLVIDTKYYEQAFQSYHGTPKLRSTHLYQLLAYLQNLAHGQDVDTPAVEGMLLYPAVHADFHKRYTLLGHDVTVRSINLGQPWRQIHDELLDAVM